MNIALLQRWISYRPVEFFRLKIAYPLYATYSEVVLKIPGLLLQGFQPREVTLDQPTPEYRSGEALARISHGLSTAAADAASLMTGSYRVVQPDGGHFMVDEQPKLVAEETLAHLGVHPIK